MWKFLPTEWSWDVLQKYDDDGYGNNNFTRTRSTNVLLVGTMGTVSVSQVSLGWIRSPELGFYVGVGTRRGLGLFWLNYETFFFEYVIYIRPSPLGGEGGFI